MSKCRWGPVPPFPPPRRYATAYRYTEIYANKPKYYVYLLEAFESC